MTWDRLILRLRIPGECRLTNRLDPFTRTLYMRPWFHVMRRLCAIISWQSLSVTLWIIYITFRLISPIHSVRLPRLSRMGEVAFAPNCNLWMLIGVLCDPVARLQGAAKRLLPQGIGNHYAFSYSVAGLGFSRVVLA